MSTDSLVMRKSMDFAIRIVHLYQYLQKEHNEYVMARQILKSGTSIGANIAEAVYGKSKKDFVAKLQIAQKETAETRYWLELLHKCEYIPDNLYDSLQKDCGEIQEILTSTLKTCSK